MGNPEVGLKVEAKIRSTDEINKLFLPGEIGAILDWEVRDTQTGEIVIDPRTGKPNVGIKKAESFVRQFMDILLVKFLNLPLKEFILINDWKAAIAVQLDKQEARGKIYPGCCD